MPGRERSGPWGWIKRTGRRVPRAALLWTGVAFVATAVAFMILRPGTEARYLQTLRDQGLAGQFASDANAIASGRRICTDLEAGERAQGLPQDKVAVDIFCPAFSDGFKVLETIRVEGTFTLIDSDTRFPSITSSGSSCHGTSGYRDIRAGVEVLVKNDEGTTLARTNLREGSGSSRLCVFQFDFMITEGESNYVVEVGRRGSISYSFTDLKLNGPTLSLGD